MEIKRLISASLVHDESNIRIDGNRYFSDSKALVLFNSIEEVIGKCQKEIDEYDQFEIEIKDEIFDHVVDPNNLTYDDFVFKYGPCTHYFSNEPYTSNRMINQSDLTILDKFGGELVYPEDFRKTPNKFKFGDICTINHKSKQWYGVVYRTPNSIYDLFGKDKPRFERGYFSIGINDEQIWDFDHVSEFNMSFVKEIPKLYKEFLELISKLFKLEIEEESYDLDILNEMYREYLQDTIKWKEYKERCLKKIRDKEKGDK